MHFRVDFRLVIQLLCLLYSSIIYCVTVSTSITEVTHVSGTHYLIIIEHEGTNIHTYIVHIHTINIASPLHLLFTHLLVQEHSETHSSGGTEGNQEDRLKQVVSSRRRPAWRQRGCCCRGDTSLLFSCCNHNHHTQSDRQSAVLAVKT